MNVTKGFTSDNFTFQVEGIPSEWKGALNAGIDSQSEWNLMLRIGSAAGAGFQVQSSKFKVAIHFKETHYK